MRLANSARTSRSTRSTFRKTCGLIIGRRLERLDDNEKRVLAAAAVIGRSFSFQLLTAVSQIDVDELFTVIEKAQQMGLIVPSSEGPESRSPSRMNLCDRRCLPASRSHADSACTRELPMPSSWSIPVPLTSAPGRSLIIFARQDRSLTDTNWPVG